MSSSEDSLPGKSSEKSDKSLPDTSPQVKSEAKKSSSNFTREIIETVGLTLVIFLIIHFTIQNFLVDGPSMQPGLHTGEYVLVNKLAYTFHGPERGDVIVFELPQDTSENLIKRVIGLPGDKIVLTANTNTVTVDGVTLKEPYISAPENDQNQTLTVPANDYFVLGDNRPVSDDSRDWGFLPRQDIIGKAVMVYWPPTHIESIDTYQPVYVQIKPNS
jgi:signal peptidase I